jgi:hypothetical protein
MKYINLHHIFKLFKNSFHHANDLLQLQNELKTRGYAVVHLPKKLLKQYD